MRTKTEHIPPLTDSYRKARKGYGIAAGLLLAWELIGVELSSDNLPFSLESPDAAPLVLAALVIYFAIRLTLEWLQCEPQRREQPAASIDFHLAHVIGVGSLSVFAIQRIIDEQLFDLLEPNQSLWLLAVLSCLASMSAFAIGSSVKSGSWSDQPLGSRIFIGGVVVQFPLVFAGYVVTNIAPLASMLVWTGAGIGAGFILSQYIKYAVAVLSLFPFVGEWVGLVREESDDPE